VSNADGGYLTAHGLVYSWISQYFGEGTPLFETESRSKYIEALAPDEHTMLINKSDVEQIVNLGMKTIILLPYKVRLLEENGASVASL